MRSCKTLSVGSSGPLYPMRFNQAFWSNTAPVIGKTPYPCMSEIYPTTRRRTTLGAAQRADDVRSWAERTSQLRASRSGKGPVSDLGIAGHRPAIVLYSCSISPSLGATLSSEHVERRLAAILAADVAGSCRLIGIDEEGTLAQLKAFRKTLFDPKITDHRGRIVKNTGDGALVEFASVVDAVRCADKIQHSVSKQNTDVPLDKRIEFRIGIHVGDIIIADDDIFGDGVNIAVRLEGIAEPGGICISDDAHRQIRGKVDIAFEDIGER